MNHQDFKDIVFKKPAVIKKNVNTFEQTKEQKYEKETDILKHDTFKNHQILINARTSKNLTQKRLAAMINEKEDVIKMYESGKMKNPDNRVLQKLRNALNIKL